MKTTFDIIINQEWCDNQNCEEGLEYPFLIMFVTSRASGSFGVKAFCKKCAKKITIPAYPDDFFD